MLRKTTLLLALVTGGLLLVACGPLSPAPAGGGGLAGREVAVEDGSYTEVTVGELETLLADKDFLFVNVHIPFEGDIPGTDLSIPYDEVEQNLGQLPADQDAMVVLYCRSGRMSAIAAETLTRLGYTNVYDVAGGMVAWERAGGSIMGR